MTVSSYISCENRQYQQNFHNRQLPTVLRRDNDMCKTHGFFLSANACICYKHSPTAIVDSLIILISGVDSVCTIYVLEVAQRPTALQWGHQMMPQCRLLCICPNSSLSSYEVRKSIAQSDNYKCHNMVFPTTETPLMDHTTSLLKQPLALLALSKENETITTTTRDRFKYQMHELNQVILWNYPSSSTTPNKT